jgi:hypothetical protein
MNSRTLLPLSGVATVVLTLVAFIVAGEPPDVDAAAPDLVSYYVDNDSDLQFAAAFLALAAFFFVLFTSVIASLLRGAREPDSVTPYVTFGGGIIFAVGATIFAGLTFTAGEIAEDVDVETLRLLNGMEMNMFFTVAVGTAAFLLGAGVGALKSGLLPRWLAWVAVVLGVLAITPLGFASFVGLGVWTLIVSVMLFMRARSAPAEGARAG